MRKYILEFLLYQPRVYAGLDHLMVNLCQIACKNGYTVVCVYNGSLSEQPQIRADIEDAGGIVEVVRSKERLMAVDMWHLYWKYRPAVVNMHFHVHLYLFSEILSKLFRARHIAHFHSDFRNSKREHKPHSGNLRMLCRKCHLWAITTCAHHVISVSQAIEKQIRECSFGRCKKLQTLYLGTPLRAPRYSKEEARQITNIPIGAKVLLNVTAIEPNKGIDTAIIALAELQRRGFDFLLVHIGGIRNVCAEQKAYEESLYSLAKEQGISDRIIWLGRRNDVQDIMPLADIYIHPSRSEGLGCVLMEASMASLPLVGSNIGGIPEVIIDRVNGRTVSPESPATLADAIVDVYESHKLTYGLQALHEVYTRFNQDTQAKALFNLYLK